MKKKYTYAMLITSLLVQGTAIPVSAQEVPFIETEPETDTETEFATDTETEIEQESSRKIIKQGVLGTSKWTIDSNGVLRFGAGVLDLTTPPERFEWKTPGLVTRIDGTASVKVIGNMHGMFSDMHDLVSADLSGFNTAEVTDMSYLFTSCVNLESLNLKNFNTSNVTNMNSMFWECSSLDSINVSSFNTAKVTDMGFMFYQCGVHSLNLSNFDTSNVTVIGGMFGCADYLAYLDISGFDTRQIDMTNMVNGGIFATWNGSLSRISTIKYRQTAVNMFHQLSQQNGWYLDNRGPYSIDKLPALSNGRVGTLVRTKNLIDFKNVKINGVESKYILSGGPVTPIPTVTLNGKTLVKDRDYVLSYRKNTSGGTASLLVTGIGDYVGTKKITFTIVEPSSAKRMTMHRLYNPNSGEHFYTAADNEKNFLVKSGWKYEGTGWIAPEISRTAVYRLYNKNAGDHHYTMNSNEKDFLVKSGWTYEGIGWYSDDAKGVPLYRQYNPNAKAGSHNYTPSKGENDFLVQNGWKAEGISWYGLK